MQIARSQSQQARQKIDKFRLSLCFAVFFPYVLFLALFNVLLLRVGAVNRSFLTMAALLLAATAGLLVFSWVLIGAILRERRLQRKEVARANCLISIVEVLCGPGSAIREKMKRAGRLLAAEGDPSGWRCRIVLQNDPSVLPPSGPSLGFHVPMTAGDKTVGTLIVSSPGRRLDVVDQNFFDVVARSIGLFVHKENSWDDFHSGATRRQAALLLQGDVENSVDNKL